MSERVVRDESRRSMVHAQFRHATRSLEVDQFRLSTLRSFKRRTLLAKQLAFDQVCVTPDEGVLGPEEVPCEDRDPAGSLRILKDHADEPELCEVDDETASPRQSAVGDKTGIEIASIDRQVAVAGGDSESTAAADVGKPSTTDHDDARESPSECNVDATDAPKSSDRAFELSWEGEAEAVDYETVWTDLESSAKSCECRLDELESDQAPPPPLPLFDDPLPGFLRRMRAEVDAGRLETIFRLPGIGSPVSPERVTAVGLWLADCARRQQGLVGPRNIRHFLCPKLHDFADCDCP
ncbi:uncharacterized protein LOC112590399 [Harpegnathos saltator]|uniref:uncharacterized protein LOC112590399 n=1 Tax=Harpegnathos saltator TaxID=610380 RepID=UPI000DBED074|nr:uncharacterized protein LOC112590399 [Harpegnathos saltator]